MSVRFGIFLLFICLVSGCSVGPEYKRPNTPLPNNWRESTSSTNWPQKSWWESFNSPELSNLIKEALRSNDDLAAAIARVRQADAQVRIAGSALLPAVNASFDATRARQLNISTQKATTYSDYSPLLSASYEIDFWGKNRALKNAAKATAEASRFDQSTIELTIVSSVAEIYFQALSLRDRIKVAQDDVNAAQAILDGLTLEEEVGTATALDVAQQSTVTATLSAAIPPLRQQYAQTIDALAILLGKNPENLALDENSLSNISLPPVLSGISSELLTRRPDISEAEAELRSANANIQAARAALFPSITLTADGGFESGALSSLLSPESRVFSLSAGLLQPIFEGGALLGQIDLNKGRYAELAANYHKVVISALGNVEDALASAREIDVQEKKQVEALEKAQQAYDIAQMQFNAGTINILTVLNTESALFSARDSLLQVQLAHLIALTSLYRALGGGWRTES